MAVDVDAPTSTKGVLLVVGLVILIVTALFASSLGTILFAAVFLLIAGYLLLVIGGRLHDWLRHGKPLMRRRARKQQQQGGEK